MSEKIIIGIHGLLNKPPKDVLHDWWAEAIIEGLQRNHNETAWQPNFQLAYWADVRTENPIAVQDLDERYEPADGQGPLRRHETDLKDKARALAHKWGGRFVDKGKDLLDLGAGVEILLAVKLEDLSDYYQNEQIRVAMRTTLSTILEQNNEKDILLIAHSMGSIIAYDVLRGYDESLAVKVGHFITIGSPLGLPYVSKKVREEFGNARTPMNVARWTNMADPGDKVSIDVNLADDFSANSNGARAKDLLVHNEYVNRDGKANNHKSYGYLRTPEMSDRIREFLQQ